MRRIRLFVDQPLQAGLGITLSEAAANHAVRVLRLREGDAVTLFNGDGHDYSGEISLGKREARVHIGRVDAVANESPLAITLVQAIARGEKMDLILQKATELGVAAITPVVTERTEVRLDAERALKRHQHWLGVIQSACEQCGRARVPVLEPSLGLAQALARGTGSPGWLLDPQGEHALATLPTPTDAGLTLLIGPEGGLGNSDLRAAHAAGFSGLRLGPRILRTETAGLAAIAALQARFGDLG